MYRLRVLSPDGSSHIMHLEGYGDAHPDVYNGDGFFGIKPDGKIAEYFDQMQQKWLPSPCARNNQWYPLQQQQTLRYYSSDGSFLKLEQQADGVTDWAQQPWTLYFPDGRRLERTASGNKFVDANGNSIVVFNSCYDWPACTRPYGGLRDDTGREIRRHTTQNTPPDLREDVITAPGPNGEIQWTIHWEVMSLGSGRTYYRSPIPINDPQFKILIQRSFFVVKNIQLPLAPAVPLGQTPPAWNSYEFKYRGDEHSGYGQVDYVRVPSGARYEYEYNMDGAACQFACPEMIATNNWVKKRTVTYIEKNENNQDVERTLTWTYDFGSLNSSSSTINNPDGGQIINYFYQKNSGGWNSGLVFRIVQPNGSVIKRSWAQNKAFGVTATYANANNPYIEKETTTVGNAQGQPSKTSVSKFVYDKNGNLRSRTDYDDWVAYAGSDVMEPDGSNARTTELDYYVTVPLASSVADNGNAYWNASRSPRLNAIKSRSIKANAKTYAITKYIYDYPLTRGNVLKEIRWDSPEPSSTPPAFDELGSSNSQVLSRAYDSYGNLTDIYEPEVRTHATYDADGNVVTRLDKAYGTSAQRSWQYTWLNGVAVGSKIDLDNNLTTSYVYDTVGRQTSVIEAGLKQTLTAYDDANNKITVTSDLRSFNDRKLQTVTHYDQLGRAYLTRKSENTPLIGDTDGIKTRTFSVYTSGGRRVITTAPYRNADYSDTTLEWTCTQYDQSNRVTAVAMFKGSALPGACENAANRTGISRTEYDAEWTINTDPMGKIRRQKRDALGRLLEVVEDPLDLSYRTLYDYDPLENLVRVTQGSQIRSFSYSSLSRLLSATNPESGTVTYTYHDSGELKRRTDARGVWSESTYDSLHRILTKSYSDGTPAVTYEYNLSGLSSSPNIGFLKSINSGAASTVYSGYNALGQIMASTHAISGYSGSQAFSYDWLLTGSLKTETYPSGHVINYSADDAGRTNRVWASEKTYADLTASGISYPFTPDGRIAQMKLGNNLWETRDYHTPGTTTTFRLGTALGAGDRIQLEYNYSGTANNGNLSNLVIIRPGYSWQQNFTYDGVNRLLVAAEASGWTQSYTYDRWGNRSVTTAGLSHGDPHESGTLNDYNTLNNQLTKADARYDAAGNQIFYNPFNLGYDAEGRITSITSSSNGGGSFSYDGEGRRVKKSWTPNGGATVTNYFVYDALGRLAAEYSNQAPASTGTSWMFTDMLGSVRAITAQDGSVAECYDYLPFGRMLKAGDNGRSSCFPSNPDIGYTSNAPQKFTGKERDTETGLDFFGARYFSGGQGRFMIPDPSSGGVTPFDPQSWNKYSYVRNRPTRFMDIGGNWATEIHVQLTNYVLRDYVSAEELSILVGQQSVMDNNHNEDGDQYMHAMSNGRANPPQTAADAKKQMNGFLSWNLRDAKAKLNKNGSFSNASLVHLGNAIHTLQDTTSSMHMQNGEPLPWYGMKDGGYSHWTGENEPSDNWSGIGRAIFKSMAALMDVNPDQAAKKGLTAETFEREVSKQIDSYFNATYNGSEKDRDAARQCALGNPAACE
jgi:RHS repeat-associated protein